MMNATLRLASLVKETSTTILAEASKAGTVLAPSREIAEQALRRVLATDEGKALWERKRLEELEAGKGKGLALRGAFCSGAGARFDSLVSKTENNGQMTMDGALNLVLASDEGKALWEQKRAEELSLSSDDRHLTQEMRNSR